LWVSIIAQVERSSIAVLRVFDQEDHDQLPAVREVEEWTCRDPNQDQGACNGESDRRAQRLRRTLRQGVEARSKVSWALC
jgi:hypothetical protein